MLSPWTGGSGSGAHQPVLCERASCRHSEFVVFLSSSLPRTAAELPLASLWASFTGFDLYELWRGHHRIPDRGRQAGSFGLERSRADEERWSIQLARRDSWSTRAIVAPASNWAAQCSIGRLEHPEALEPGSQWRPTGSLEYNRPPMAGTWTTTLLWRRVHKIATETNLNSYRLESRLNFQRRNYAFSRLDLVDAYDDYPVSFQIFLRMRPGESGHGHH